MKDKLLAEVLTFLRQHRGHASAAPILLGFSGGPDSLALLHVLLAVGKLQSFDTLHPFRFALAHVDHGWRPESGAEAVKIQEMAVALGLTVHLKTLSLSPGEIQGNPESICREARLNFFAGLCRDFGYQAVMLAHHADDLAETVLKRVLEGASLCNLSGIKPVNKLYGVDVWRPLLKITKKEILRWLQERNLEGFHDSTNVDPKFLRARLRMDVLPNLSKVFGKEVCSGLCHISNESAELIDYLDANIAPYLARVTSDSAGMSLDLSECRPTASAELKHLIRRFCECGELNLSRESLNLAANFVSTGAARKSLGDGSLQVDRYRLQVAFAKIRNI
ncbi:MAG: tRNA lysidine(34) synthetase TilS [Parachlamydiaceae bacterium]